MDICSMCQQDINLDEESVSGRFIISFRRQRNKEFFICERCMPSLRNYIHVFDPGIITDRSKKQHYYAKDKREKFTKDMHRFYDYYHDIVDARLPKAIEAVEFMGFSIMANALREILQFVKEMFNAVNCYDQGHTKDCPCCGTDTPGWPYSKYYKKPEEAS